MVEDVSLINKRLDAAKRNAKGGGEYWMARDIQEFLGYEQWRNFEDVIVRARKACESAGVNSGDHFAETSNMVPVGSGAMRDRKDFFLTRYACYLIAMNGDTSKPEIGIAQTYFAVQTRRMEIQDAQEAIETRIELRNRVRSANKDLSSVAKNAGVQRFDIFHDAGYKGLYGMGLRDIKQHKGIEKKDDLLDRAGRAELAANEFRITQAEQKIVREGIKGQEEATKTHKEVGKEVRDTIKKLGGTMPEDLPVETSLKKLKKPTDKKKLKSGS